MKSMWILMNSKLFQTEMAMPIRKMSIQRNVCSNEMIWNEKKNETKTCQN